ncbi:hypothetical protein CRYUN_Cryun05aG0238700 [Craigia yunnanensis]
MNSIPEMIRKQIASFYLWPQTIEIPILDGLVGATKKPVGILHVKVVRALKLLKMDLLGSSDPYVKLSVGTHDKLGMQVVPLRLLTPHETQEFSLDLVKNTNPNDPQIKKRRGQLMVQLTFNPFKEDNERFSGPLDRYAINESGRLPKHDGSICGAGLLSVLIQSAEDVEGKYHNNPYALIVFKGEKKRTKLIKKTRDPCWNEEFQFVLEEAPLKDMIHIEVMSKRTHFSLLRRKESLGHVDINLNDVVYNGRINEKYNLINSKNDLPVWCAVLVQSCLLQRTFFESFENEKDLALAGFGCHAKRPYGVRVKVTTLAILDLCFIFVWSMFSSLSTSVTVQRESFDDIVESVTSGTRGSGPNAMKQPRQGKTEGERETISKVQSFLSGKISTAIYILSTKSDGPDLITCNPEYGR